MFAKKNIRVQCIRTLGKIRSFLLTPKSREFLIFLFFVFVSFFFWLLQVLNDDYETELSVPLKMKNVPENVVLTSELPKEIKVRLHDRGAVLVNYLYGQTIYPVVVDFNDYSERGNQVRILTSTLNKRIVSQLSQSTKVLSFKPDTLEFIYTRGEGKKVPVKLRGEVKAQRQYYISDVVYSPDSVMVYAPKEILDTITSAYTESVYLENIEDTVRHRVALMPVKGARFKPLYNDITFLVDVFSEKTVEVPIRGINFPNDKILRTFPSKIQLTFQVGLSRFKNINAEDFDIVVDYEQLRDNKTEKCKPILMQTPTGVHHVRMNPQEIEYIIEQKLSFND